MTDTSSSVVSGQTVTIETRSAWLSKINWTQAVAVTASMIVLLTGGKVDIPPEVQAQIVVGIGVLQGIVTWVFKTWFTPTVTPASISRSGLKTVTTD